MSEREEPGRDILHCDLCGARVYLARCHQCHPVQAPDRDEFLAEWAALPAAERLGSIPKWIDSLANTLALNIGYGEATPERCGAAAKRLVDFVKLAGDGDVELGIERLRALEQAKRLVA